MILLLTQPEQQAKKLASTLAAYTTQVLPLFSIEPLPVATPTIVSKLQQADIILCTSPSVVGLLPKQMPKEALAAPWFTPGQGTADYLLQRWPLNVSYPKEQHNSEALMRLPELQQVTGKTVVLLTGVAGRRYIEDTLSQRLASVHRLELYQSQPIEIATSTIQKYSDAHHLWLVTSSATLLRLMSFGIEPMIHLLVTSQRLAKLAEDNGYNCSVAVSNKRADIAQVLQSIERNTA